MELKFKDEFACRLMNRYSDEFQKSNIVSLKSIITNTSELR